MVESARPRGKSMQGSTRPLSSRRYSKLEQQDVQPSTLPLTRVDECLLALRKCVAAHVDSFDFAVESGLHVISDTLEPVYVRGPKGPDGNSTLIALRIHSLSVQKPRANMSGSTKSSFMRQLYPSECRRTGATYQGELYGAFSFHLNGRETVEVPVQKVGRIPVMVGSSLCHLRGKSRHELIALGEEEYEMGGTFIINGTEKVIRLINVPRSNHAISAKREKNSMRGSLFTDLSVSYRSMRRDMSTFTLHFHLVRSGAIRVRLVVRRNEYFIPVGVLFRALLPSSTTDQDIFELIVGGERDHHALCNAAVAIIKELSERYPLFKKADSEPNVATSVSMTAATAYLGRSFKSIMGLDDENISDVEAGEAFLRQYIFVHLSVTSRERRDASLDGSKADLLVLVIRKLVLSWSGDIEVDNADALSHQSVMAAGQLYLSFLKEKLESTLRIIAAHIRREADKSRRKAGTSVEDLKPLLMECLTKTLRADQVTLQMAYMISTGNLRTESGLDLPQTVGYAVLAERINFLRFLSHFRAVHRGAFYATMRSTKVRKLLPEAWGFVCPVHTPDGDPCGILNHLASGAIVSSGSTADIGEVLDLFSDFNFTPAPGLSAIHRTSQKGCIPVVVDGRVLGFVEKEGAQELADQVRYSKIRKVVKALPDTTEVALILPSESKGGFQPGLFVHTGGGRLLRPVWWLNSPKKKVTSSSEDEACRLKEYIGTLEQVFLRVCPAFRDIQNSLNSVNTAGASHAELSPRSFLSVLASLSPFPEMNQGPRNMFQCQMAKQTMGTPCHTTWSRMESKIYRHTSPQVPITRNFCMQDAVGADLFPNGVNAVVAVISYTGNDMEDALVINKASLERGFAHGTVYVNHRIDLDETIAGRETKFLPLTPDDMAEVNSVEFDGLPAVGARLTQGSMLYGTCGKHVSGGIQNGTWKRYKSVEDGTVDEVTIFDSDMYRGTRRPRGQGIREANIRTRVSRRPCVGDKFASRAGQKGTMSAAWPSEDMPFSESGITPDILFNPNGFPSRMTIGMMVESMSGKAGALHGHFNDSSPFQFDEENRAVDFFADQLVRAGYDYAGTETLYSGYSGEPFEVNIFTGVVHYQRLRHMVADKFQVRTTGPIHPLFRQPIKGRKKGGAIRFGEMERDGLLAHGASFLLRDRLAMASDMHLLHVCSSCGSLLTPVRRPNDSSHDILRCRACHSTGASGTVEKVAMPYSFKYLANELAAMNVRTVLELKEVA